MSRRGRGQSLRVVTMGNFCELHGEELEKLYSWVDEIPLSRAKKNMTRDFSDGVMVAEILKHYIPKIIDVHSYVSAQNTKQKQANWFLLNRKVFKKISLDVQDDVVRAICNCRPNIVEYVLNILRERIDMYMASNAGRQVSRRADGASQVDYLVNDRTEVDQNFNRGFEAEFGDHLSYDPFQSSMGRNSRGQESASNLSGLQNAQGVQPMKSRQWLERATEDMLPKEYLDEKQHLLESKQQTIEMLQAKVQRLEHLLRLKDIRIEDMTTRYEQLEGMMPPTRRQKEQRSHMLAQGGSN